MTSPRPGRSTIAFTVASALLAACLAARPAAGAGLSIAWNDCSPPLGAGSINKLFGCGSDIQEFALFPSFSLAASLDSVYSMEVVVDFNVAGTEGDPLPAWWLMAAGCHANGWAADGTASLTCTDAWGGQGTGSFQGWIPGTPGNSTRHARLLVASGTLPQDAVTLLGGASYTACRILLRSTNTSCDSIGCRTPACLVFNSLLVRRLHTPADEEIVISGPETGGSDRAVWNSGPLADCAAVPVRRTTWGAVKALYH